MQHNVNCRLAQAVVVPEAIPPERLDRYGARGKLRRYPGLKEEYYLADFEPDGAVLAELGLDPAEPIAVVRTPPAVSLYHRFENDLFGQVLERLRGAQTVVLPRTPEQRAELARAGGFIVPETAIDAQSLIAYADLVVSAGGTMNREAVALGNAGVHGVRGPARRRRRAADRRGPAGTAASDPSRCSWSNATRATDAAPRDPPSASGAIRRSSSTCSHAPSTA